jgi:hypothetical protein
VRDLRAEGRFWSQVAREVGCSPWAARGAAESQAT